MQQGGLEGVRAEEDMAESALHRGKQRKKHAIHCPIDQGLRDKYPGISFPIVGASHHGFGPCTIQLYSACLDQQLRPGNTCSLGLISNADQMWGRFFFNALLDSQVNL